MKPFHFLKMADELQQRSDLGISAVYLYSKMYDKFTYYHKQGKPYTPCIEYLAVECNMSERAVKTYLKLMREIGLINVVGKGVKGRVPNSYVVRDYRMIKGLLTKPSVEDYYKNKRDEAYQEHMRYLAASDASGEAQEETLLSYSMGEPDEPEELPEPVEFDSDEPTAEQLQDERDAALERAVERVIAKPVVIAPMPLINPPPVMADNCTIPPTIENARYYLLGRSVPERLITSDALHMTMRSYGVSIKPDEFELFARKGLAL